MRVEGDSISIRLAEFRDADLIHAWENDTSHWLVSNTSVPFTLDQIMNFLENDNDIYASNQMRFMIEAKDGLALGCLDLFDFDPKNKRVGVGILIDQQHRGKGHGRQALNLVIPYCFDSLDVQSLHADILEDNSASRALFEACGFTISGVKKKWLWNGESYINQLFYQRFPQA